MAEDKATEDKGAEAAIDELIAELEKGAKDEADKATETVEEKPEEKPKEEDFNVEDAALSVLDRMGRDKFEEYIQKRGYVPAKKGEKEDAEKKAADAAATLTAEQFLNKSRSLVSDQEMDANYPGWRDLGIEDQAELRQFHAIDRMASEKSNAALQPFQQAQARAGVEAEKDATAQGWAQELGSPESAQGIRQMLAEMTPDEWSLAKSQSESGGGFFIKSIHEKAKAVAQSVQAEKEKSQEVSTMKSEPTGGTSKTYEPELTGHAKSFLDRLSSDPDLSKDKELVAAVRSAAAGVYK